MGRGLYRVYLYVVTIALLVFATVSVGMFLATALALTPLRSSDQYGPPAPTSSEVAQRAVLAVVTLIIVVALGGLHYWLIRRDTVSDPQAGASGVRSFTLNLAEVIATMVAVVAAASALDSIGQQPGYDVSGSTAVALSALGLTLALEWERRRAPATRGAALVFQRLRVDGLALILALTLTNYLGAAVDMSQRGVAEALGRIQCSPPPPNGPYVETYFVPCVGSELIGLWASALFVLAAWLVYLRLGLADRRTLIRPVFLLLGFTAGVVSLIIGLERAVEYALRLTTTGAAHPSYFTEFNFGPFFVYAAALLAVYGWRLRDGAALEPLSRPVTGLTMRAIAAALFAGPFWYGCGYLLYHLFTAIGPGSTSPTPAGWDTAAAFALAGLPYIPLAIWLARGSTAEGFNGPRRGFVLALLAAGALVTAGSAATLIYTVVTSALGVALPSWQNTARGAGAALVVGVVLGGIYLFIAIRERQFARPERPPVEAPAESETLEAVLTGLQQGALSREEAAQRIRSLAEAGALR